MPHGLRTTEAPGTVGLGGATGLAGAACPTRYGRPFPVARAWSNAPLLLRAQL
jgi:hypothetical protein